MKTRGVVYLALVTVLVSLGSLLVAQDDSADPDSPGKAAAANGNSSPEKSAGDNGAKNNGDKKGKPPEPPPLPNDKRLLALHLEFVKKAEKLAAEYEHNKQSDKAAAVYGEILKLVPAYPKAQQMVAAYQAKENTADRATFDVKADADWQDTGVRLIAGKPFQIKASGSWTFNMSHVVAADGMEIPKELRGFKLGSLIGVVGAGDPKKAKPFAIGGDFKQVAEQSGPLLVRMHDSVPDDNVGKLKLEIVGRFDKK